MGSVARPRPGKLTFGIAIVAAYVLAGAFAGVLTQHDPTAQDLIHRLAAPGDGHPLGTDALGRDELSRLLHAIRVDLRVGVLAAALPMLIGTAVGAVAGYAGGLLDAALMRLADLVQSFPVLVFLLAVVAAVGPGDGWWVFGPGELPIVGVFAAVGWVLYARLIRSEILRVRELDYVQAARAGGLSGPRVLVRHVLPNALDQTIVYVVLDVGLAVLALATLSYLGLGVSAPTPEWGAMIADARSYLDQQWWLVVLPGLAIAGLGTGLALIGDALDDRLKSR
jgi:peptide/nickel transport system permease protein